MYCLHCRYPLVGLTTDVCPECGRPFVAADPRTWTRWRSPWIRRLIVIVVLGLFLGATLTGWRQREAIHLWATDPWEPFTQQRLDDALARGEVVMVYCGAEWELLDRPIRRIFEGRELRNLMWQHSIEVLHADLTDNQATANWAYYNSLGDPGLPCIVLYDRDGQPTIRGSAIVLPAAIRDDIRKAVRKK